MLGRIIRIFQRYADCHLRLDRPARVLGGALGRIDTIKMRANRIAIKGWTQADRVGLELDGLHGWTTPALTQPNSPAKGYEIDIPFRPGVLELLLEIDGKIEKQRLDAFSPRAIALKRQLLWPRFCKDVLSLLPEIYRWKYRGDLGARELVKEGLGLVPTTQPQRLQSNLFGPITAQDEPPFDNATIVLPVYNSGDLVRECIRRVQAHSDLSWRMIVIDDASPEAEIWPMLEEIAKADERILLSRNAENKGFVQTVNSGFQTARDQWPDAPVILLNSDAFVPQGWLSRLLAPLGHHDVASVTPFSNDAEIFTAPVICQRHDLASGLADKLDKTARRIALEPADIEAPTGVGFCMAMAPRFLSALPRFDTIFGRGYGEETDWCQKARAMGGRHVCALNLFVEHRGGESFGSATKQRLLETNLKVISKRYPAYDREVQSFLHDDPLNTPRLALALAWAGLNQSAPVPVYIAHAMGGGAEIWLQRQIRAETAAGRSIAVLRVGQGARYVVELHCPYGATRGASDSSDMIVALLGLLRQRKVIYSCGVGDRDASALPALITRVAEDHPIEILFHDFFPISPSYTLIGSDGVFHGVPTAKSGEPITDKAHQAERPGGARVSLAEWQSAWGAVMRKAARITVFSEDSKAHVIEAYPETEPAIVVAPHAVTADIPRIAPVCEAPPVIGVLGNIGYHKGAELISKLSRVYGKSGDVKIVVVGQMDPAYPLDKRAAVVHGSYEMRDLPSIVQKHKITSWMIASIWPETFSFTTHEALATGMPVICFDLGAQGEAVKKAQAAGAPALILPHETPEPFALGAQIQHYLEDFISKAQP